MLLCAVVCCRKKPCFIYVFPICRRVLSCAVVCCFNQIGAKLAHDWHTNHSNRAALTVAMLRNCASCAWAYTPSVVDGVEWPR